MAGDQRGRPQDGRAAVHQRGDAEGFGNFSFGGADRGGGSGVVRHAAVTVLHDPTTSAASSLIRVGMARSAVRAACVAAKRATMSGDRVAQVACGVV